MCVRVSVAMQQFVSHAAECTCCGWLLVQPQSEPVSRASSSAGVGQRPLYTYLMPVQSYVSACVCVCVCVVCLLLFIAKLIAYLCSLAFNVPAQSELALLDFTTLVLVLKKYTEITP